MKRILWLFLTLGITLPGCSDLNDGKAKNPDRVIAELQKTNCTVNTDNLDKILSEPIPGEINCIYDQLSVLMSLVRSERPDLGGKNITRRTLENFIRKYVPNAVEALEYFDIFFILNSFIFGSEEGILIQEDFRRLRDFLIMFNSEISEIYPHLQKLDENDRIGIKFHLNIKEQKILNAVKVITKDARTPTGENISLLGLLEVRPTQERTMDLIKLFDHFENDDNGEGIEEIKNLVFLKKILLGGDKSILRYTEFIGFVRNNLREFVDSFYDLYRHPHLAFDNEAKRYELYDINLERVRNLIYSESTTESLVDFTDIFSVLNFYREDLLGKYSEIDFQELTPELNRLKEIFISSEENQSFSFFNGFSAQDLFAILDEAQTVVKRSLKNSVLFNDNKNYLLSNTGRIKNGDEIQTDLEADDKDLLSFVNTIVKFRYFKGDNVVPFFGDEIQRNIKSINLIGALNYMINKVFKFYEVQYPCDSTETFNVYNYGPKQIHKDHRCNTADKNRTEDYKGTLNSGQLYFVVLEFRKLLYETRIVGESREDKSGENAASIPDLFLDSANDNGLLESEEFIEFLLGLFDSISIRKKVTPFIDENCEMIDDTAEYGGPRYGAKCVRDHFYETFSNNFKENGVDFNYFEKFPKFQAQFEDWEQANNEDLKRKYILLLEKFTKVCSFDNVPYTQADVMGLYTSVISVESTLNKFDINNNNVIDKDEAKTAYKHFARGLKSILNTMIPGVKLGFLSKNFFKFLTDKKRLPDTKFKKVFKSLGDVFNLLLVYNFKPYSSIDREKIITVFTALGESGEPKRKKRLGSAYETKQQYCTRTSHVNEFVTNEWQCYVENKQSACDAIEP